MRINLPAFTRALLAATSLLSVIAIALKLQLPSLGRELQAGSSPAWLVLIPAQSLVYPWTLLTASFVETNIVSLLVTLATLTYGGRYLERAWGSSEFARFILAVSIAPVACSLATEFILFAVTSNTHFSLAVIGGGLGLQSGVLVAFKQLVPEHTVTLFRGIVKIRVRHFPLFFLIVNGGISLMLGSEIPFLLAGYAFLSAWIYLRFYKRASTGVPAAAGAGAGDGSMIKGDASETFSFAHFFPDVLHPVVSPVADGVWRVMLAVRLCAPFSVEDIEAGNLRVEARREGMGRTAAPLPGSARAEAERRRALALKALDQRLQTSSTGKPSAQPPTPSTMSSLTAQ